MSGIINSVGSKSGIVGKVRGIEFIASDVEPTDKKGNMYYDNSEQKLKHYDGTAWRRVDTQSRTVINLNNGVTDQYVNIGDNEGATKYRFMQISEATSCSMWFKASANATKCLFSLNDDNGSSMNYIIDTTAGNIWGHYTATGAGTQTLETGYAMTYLNLWTHVIFAVSDRGGSASGTTTTELFVNGVSRDTDSTSHTGRNDGSYLDFGAIGHYVVGVDGGASHLTGSSTASENFSGLVSQVALFDTKINAANALAIYNGGVPLSDLTRAHGNYDSQNSLVGLWELDGGYNDTSGQLCHQDAAGSPVFELNSLTPLS